MMDLLNSNEFKNLLRDYRVTDIGPDDIKEYINKHYRPRIVKKRFCSACEAPVDGNHKYYKEKGRYLHADCDNPTSWGKRIRTAR